MQKPLLSAFLGVLSLGSFAVAQSQPQAGPYDNSPRYPAPTYQNAPAPQHPSSLASQMTPQMLGEMLRTAATFSAMVHNMNLSSALGPDQHTVGPDGQLHHSMERTAQTIGAGAGAGAALGAMSKNQNGVMIGALIGGAAGLIIDQIMKEQEVARAKAANNAAPSQAPSQNQYQYDPRQLRQRDPQF
jgi:hypothetical protein